MRSSVMLRSNVIICRDGNCDNAFTCNDAVDGDDASKRGDVVQL